MQKKESFYVSLALGRKMWTPRDHRSEPAIPISRSFEDNMSSNGKVPGFSKDKGCHS
jgi:hypothetical protein